MTTKSDAEFTIFQWKIANISNCWWLRKDEKIESPPFIADSLEGTKWSVSLYPMGDEDDEIGVFLVRGNDCCGPNVIEVNFMIAFHCYDYDEEERNVTKYSFQKGFRRGIGEKLQTVFVANRETFLPYDTLTLHCKIWSAEKTPLKPKYLYATTIFGANQRLFEWRIDKFSTFKAGLRNQLKDELFHLDLILNGQGFDKTIVINIKSFDQSIKYFSLKTSIVDSNGKKENCGMNEYFVHDFMKIELLSKLNMGGKLMENKNQYLLNDVLNLICEVEFVTETVSSEFLGCDKMLKSDTVKNKLNVEQEKSQNTTDFLEDLKSMYKSGIFSDTELRTSTQTFPAHKSVLSIRSPVFRNMFSTDMRENNTGYVNITDLEDDIVHRMLLYIYTDTLEDLQFEIASKLYTAADKYEILTLKNKCSSFLKENLCPKNVCNVLLLADLHHDNDLKSYVQSYIFEHDEVFRLEEWDHFMETNIKLASHIMHRKLNPDKYQSI